VVLVGLATKYKTACILMNKGQGGIYLVHGYHAGIPCGMIGSQTRGAVVRVLLKLTSRYTNSIGEGDG